jgi:hydroxymethylbilane synthase
VAVDMRGNLQTRLEKLKNGDCDAMLLAFAGVHRMEMAEYVTEHLATELFVPAVGQGSVAIQSAKNLDPKLCNLIREACNHKETEACLLTERTLLAKLDGGCSVPVYGYARIEQEKIHIQAGVLSLDGKEKMEHETTGINHGIKRAFGAKISSTFKPRKKYRINCFGPWSEPITCLFRLPVCLLGHYSGS